MNKIPERLAWDDKRHVLFKDGTSGRYNINLYHGGALTGDPTAWVVRADGMPVWVKPGESVEFIEA